MMRKKVYKNKGNERSEEEREKAEQREKEKHKEVKVKVKVKFTLQQATKTQRGSRGIAVPFL